MLERLDHRKRYLQIAFNYDRAQAMRVLPSIPRDDRILVEAGTPFIKREGMAGIRALASLWKGGVIADLKVVDGAAGEVELAAAAGATAATVAGSAPRETIDIFIARCLDLGIDSMIDMIGVEDPLSVMRHLRKPPGVIVLHRGRDEEGTRGKVIQYKHVNKIRSKFDVLISAAGGIDLREARSAIFNGANIIVANIVTSRDPWTGIGTESDVGAIAKQFLQTIE